jgi:outer membrane protein
MKKPIILLLFTLFALISNAQTDSLSIVGASGTTSTAAKKALHFGYLSYDSVFHSMNGYAQAVKNLKQLKSRYQDEMKRAEDDFNQKYEVFLDGQKDFPHSILMKRQKELQEIMDKNVAFKEESRRLLVDAENDMFAPLQERLGKAISAIGREKGFAFILNTDYNACPFIDPSQGEDITALAISRVK